MLIQQIIFALLGAALYLCASAFGDEVLEVQTTIGIEANFILPNPTGVTRCMVTSNTGVEFSLVPLDPNIPSGITRGLMDEHWNTCGMVISSPTFADAGVWTIQAFIDSNEEEPEAIQKYLLSVTDGIDLQMQNAELVEVFPSRTISIFPGNSMTLRLANQYENLISCIATLPDGEKFDVLNTETEFSSDVRAYDQCGVTVRADNHHAGTWRLDATIQNDEDEKQYYYGNFYVLVRNLSIINTETTVTHVQRGAPASISLGPSEAVSCQLRDPRGQTLPLQSGHCNVNIPAVTDAHEGLWTASYSLHGNLNPVEKVTEIIAYDDHKLNATVSTMDGQINLLCSVRTYSFSFCQFVKPDGTVLNVFEGIGNDRYGYYGHGTQSSSMLTERIHECGITILVPDHSDAGSWKCILDTSSGLTGSLLTVEIPGNSKFENVVASELASTIYVVKGNSFTVKCNANVALKYCWMSSPNGTAYSVSSIQSSPTTLHYDGMGLSLGECSAVIPAAEDTDEGEWKCGMGLSDGHEVISAIPVIVTETLLFPNTKNVTVHQAQLSCSLIPGHEESIDYCRWIKPDGSGIGHWSSHDHTQPEYITHNTDDICHLEIKLVDDSSDIGSWTCVAGLVGSSAEVSATIQVLKATPRHAQYSSGRIASWSVGLGLTMISILAAIVLVTAMRIRFQSRRSDHLPPSYEKSDLGLPPAMTPYAQEQP